MKTTAPGVVGCFRSRLKPLSFFGAIAARLKPCPDANLPLRHSVAGDGIARRPRAGALGYQRSPLRGWSLVERLCRARRKLWPIANSISGVRGRALQDLSSACQRSPLRGFWRASLGVLVGVLITAPCYVRAQDAATGAIRGTVEDVAGARIASATVMATDVATGIERRVQADAEGVFWVQLLPPGEYAVRVEAAGMAPQVRKGVNVELGALVELQFRMTVAPTKETIEVSGATPLVETQPTAVSAVLDERALEGLPLNGRRFSDLALLTPGVTQDPRSLTSASNGDLAFGGVRGFQSSFLVDGADNNNAFFAQARGRYRAPYQFSNETVKEFRVSSNSYGAELGRAGGAVVNVVTKSGGNYTHGSVFYYVRDSAFNARHPFVDFKPTDRQQ